jgi:hypothetical protein
MDSDDLYALRNLAHRLFAPLERACASREAAAHLLTELGYVAPAPVTAFEKLNAGLGALDEIFESIGTLSVDSSAPDIAAAGQRALQAVKVVVDAINGVTANLQSDFAGSAILTQTDLVAQLVRKFSDYLVARLLEDYYGTLSAALNLLGVIETETMDEPATEFDAEYIRRTIHWDKLKALISDPIGTLTANLTTADEVLLYRWLYYADLLGVSFGLPAGFRSPDEPVLRHFNDGADLLSQDDSDRLTTLQMPFTQDPASQPALEFYPVRDLNTKKFTGIAATLGFNTETEIPLGERYRLTAKVSANLAEGLGIRLSREGEFRLSTGMFSGSAQALADAVQLGARLTIEPTVDDAPISLVQFGAPGGSRLQIGSGALSFGVERQGALDLFFEGDLKDGLIELRTDEADSFIGTLLPEGGISTSFSLGLGFSNRTGFYFKGSASLTIRAPVHVALGPVDVEYLGVAVSTIDEHLVLDVTAGLGAQIGPIAVSVDEVGLRARFATRDDRSGNLGPLDADFAFKPPTGVGLAIDAGVLKGGGYLYFDPDRGEYAGALELTLSDFLSLKAVGLITTRMPDGSRGFALLILITAEFEPPLQLGWGFRLMGVGGLFGLNRTVDLQALSLGVRTGAASSVLFPVDPVANASRVLSDLRAIFPPAPGHFLIGPMLKLGWGVSTFIQLDLGLIIETEGNCAIVGVLRILVSDDDGISILRLQSSFIGALEVDKSRGWFFASHFDSRLITITIEGEMGVLVAGAQDKNLIISNGGFHPQFEPPPLPFPAPKRIAFNIIDSDNARIRIEGYFAVTTNTVQFGARADLYLGFSGFSVDGHLQFDVLLRRKPFYLIAEVQARVSLKVGGLGVFDIDIDSTLLGPGPWRARGHGSISLLFVTIHKDFDKSWGETSVTVLPPIAIVPLLLEELARASNWRALTPAQNGLLVSLRKLDVGDDTLVLHPLGALEISQNVIPLNVTLDRVGEQIPADAKSVSLEVTGGPFVKLRDAVRSFAPAEFRNLSDADRLSAPAFQNQPSGVVAGASGSDWRTGEAVKRSVRYDVTTIDTLYRRFEPREEHHNPTLFDHFIRGAAVAQSSLSVAYRKRKQPFADHIELAPERFAVVSVTDLQAAPGTASFASEFEASEWLRQAAIHDPAAYRRFQVLPAAESEAA